MTAGQNAELHFREAEHAAAFGDDDIADGGQPGAAAERRAMHPADQRHRQRVEPLVEPRQDPGVATVLLARTAHHLRHPGEVAAGREDLSGAVHHRGPHRPVGVHGLGPRGQLADHDLVERVADLGPVQRQVLDGAVAPGEQEPVRHRYMRKTPKRASGIGALKAADRPRASASRVFAGSRMPSSQSRAVA